MGLIKGDQKQQQISIVCQPKAERMNFSFHPADLKFVSSESSTQIKLLLTLNGTWLAALGV